MRIDSTHRGWAIGTALAFGASTLLYVLYAANENAVSGGSWPGLAFGIAGFALMVLAGLLSMRKKFPIWRIGRAQTWMRGHLWLGLLSLPLIVYHAGFTFGAALTSVLMWLLLIVIVSGIAGAALQHYLPTLIMERVPMETIYEQVPHIRAQLVEEADSVVATACGALEVSVQADASSGPALQSIVRIAAEESAPLREFYFDEMRAFVSEPDATHLLGDERMARQRFERLRTVLAPGFHAAVTDLENICEEERQLSRQLRLHRMLHGWLLVHLPLSFALLALAVVHIVVALRY